jgi:hypothetical protein
LKQRFTVRGVFLVVPLILLIVFVGFGSYYLYWNSAPAETTCASCHEIKGSVDVFGLSAHRNLACKECHGTALSNGFHSIYEKGMMVVNHLRTLHLEGIRMNERQVLAVMDHCIRCHAKEHANWLSGGHSARYTDIFLNEEHNKNEQLNFDCLRCHGMYSELDINGLVEPIDLTGPWKLKNPEVALIPVIPCLACHRTHQEGEPFQNPDYSNPGGVFYQRKSSQSGLSFYNRQDKSYVSVYHLPILTLSDSGSPIKVSDDPLMRNCIQCHAPNAHHQPGTSDDQTPRGVHEGLSCLSCHDPHSNDSKESCGNCHPPISNCKQDVTRMNTTYADPGSPNNIHWVSCTDCHTNGIPEV